MIREAEERIAAGSRDGNRLGERGLVGRTLELDSHRGWITIRAREIGRRTSDLERPEQVGTDIGDDAGRGVARSRGGCARGEPATVKRDPQVALARQLRLSDVRLAGAERAVDP